MKRALQALEKMQAKLTAVEGSGTEPIAIVGMGCRFPGGADSLNSYWNLLQDGVDAITEIPPDRWDIDSYYDPDPETPGKMYGRHGGFFGPIDEFDASFFGISPREANSLDPQQRLVLEVGWEALENANQVPEQLFGSSTGVFIGVLSFEHALVMLEKQKIPQTDLHFTTGGSLAGIAGRLSYSLSVTGPSMVVDTACSSSLVAIHLACQSLRNRECNMALTGGVNLLLAPQWPISFSKGRLLAPDGRCKSFDAAADGYVRGDGCGLIVLKRFSDAKADGDRILALIRGASVNQDGASGGLTVPSGLSQEKVIQQALAISGVKPEQVGYIEAHGSGTPLGDPIEVNALGKVFCGQARPFPLTIGSVKTNFGHLEPAAGIAGLIKTVLALQNEAIPPHLHFKTPNPRIPWDRFDIEVPTTLKPWPQGETPRIAGISGFGFTGTNAHVVLEEAPKFGINKREEHPSINTRGQNPENQVERPWHLLTLSAKSEEALGKLVERYQELLEQQKSLNLANLCFTANTRRSHFKHRLSVVSSSCSDLKEELTAFLDKSDISDYSRKSSEKTGSPRVVFLFTGQGAHYVKMGYQLYQTQPTFRQSLDRCNEILRPYLEKPLLEVLYPYSPTSDLDNTAYTQPALFALEYALAKLLQHWGVMPSAVIGHSLGEFVAACIAGVFSLEDGLKLVAERGRLIRSLPSNGEMVAVRADEASVEEVLAPYSQSISIAAINGPENTVISGERIAVEKVCNDFEAKGIKATRLNIPYSSHSALVYPVLDEFAKVAETVAYSTPKINLISNVTGESAGGEIATPEYWVRHLRQPVRFASSIKTLHQQGYELFVEIGPKPVLSGMARQSLPQGDKVWLPSLREGHGDWEQLLKSLGELYVRRIPVDWLNFDQDYQRRQVALPTYPFQRQRYWLDAPTPDNYQGSQSIPPKLHPLIDKKMQSPLLKESVFETDFNCKSIPFLKDHLVFEQIIVPGSAYISMILAAAQLTFERNQCVLQDVLFPNILMISEEQGYPVQLVLTPQSENKGSFRLISLTGHDSPNEQSWSIHASGKILTEEKKASNSSPIVSLEELKAHCPREMTVEDIYETRRKGHIEIGPGFQWLEKMWCGDGEAICQISPPRILDQQAVHQLHPGLIETSFATLAILLSSKPFETWVPFRIEEIHFHHLPIKTPLWAHGSLKQRKDLPEDRQIGDIRLFDQTGRVFLEFTGLELGKSSRETLLQELQKDISKCLYCSNWQVGERKAKSIVSGKESRSWLIFTDEGGIGEQLAEQLKERGDDCFLVSADKSYQKLENQCIFLDPEHPEGFLKLIREHSGSSHFHGVVYLWSLDDGYISPDQNLSGNSKSSSLPDQSFIENAQKLGWGGVLYLVQALIGTEENSLPRLWIVTRGTQPVTAQNSPVRINHTPLWGLGRVIHQEHPELSCVLLDLDPGKDSGEVQRLFEELYSPDGETQIAFRQGTRQVARLERHILSVPKKVKTEDTEASGKKALIDPDSSYLITGGCGGLGLKVAQWMVKQGARYLVLISRRGRNRKEALNAAVDPENSSVPVSEEAEEVIHRLEEGGTKILVLQGDVSEQKEVARVLEEIPSSMPPLRGIIHAAGVINDGILMKQDLERFHQVMLPKVQGSWNLHILTQRLSLDFFVCFSSIASMFGSVGQGNYAAGNAFMDALMHYRRALGLPGLSINWGPWTEVGIAASLDQREQDRWAEQGLGSITPEKGVEILEKLLQEKTVQVAVLPVTWSKFLHKFYKNIDLPFLENFHETKQKPVVPEKLQLLIQLDEAPEKERRALLEDYIHQQIARVLGMKSSESISSRERLFDAGMDSLMAVEIRDRLETNLGFSLRSTLLFDYPTVESLVDFLAEKIPSLRDIPNKSLKHLEQEAKHFDSLDELSQDQIAEQLAKELQMIQEEKNK
ncbi:MAG: type I polyketide synthase [SAR324 cluster bacterium]|nr:type I polyketide synthase [SAR324 cluster bacterium]